MDEKKEKFIIFALAGILLLVVCLPVQRKEALVKSELSQQRMTEDGETGSLQSADLNGRVADTGSQEAYVEQLERELEELLSAMEGVGRAKAMITLRSTEEEIVEKDRPASRSSMAETDSAGGSRNTSDMDSQEETVFMTDEQGRQVPYVRKRLQPVIEGVAVLAEGGGKEQVCRNISDAIQVLFGIDANKIKIAKMKTTK